MNHTPSPAELKLKQNISLLRAVIESTNDGILVVNTDGKIVCYNQKFISIWRIPMDIIETRDDERALSYVLQQLKEPDAFLAKVHDLYKRPLSESFDVLEFKDGRIVERYSKPHCIDEECVGRVWSFRDITKQESAINDLRAYQESLERQILERTEEIRKAKVFVDSIIENIPDMISVKEAAGLKFLRLNRAGEELWGHSQEEMIGKDGYDFLSREQADAFTAMDRAVLSSGKVMDIPEETLDGGSRGERVLHTKKIPIYDGDGNPEYLLSISEDITEKIQAEKNRIRLMEEQISRIALEETLRLRDEFISIASHELKTPLTTLLIQVQLIHKLVEQATIIGISKEKLLSMLNTSIRQVDRFTSLINNLLDTSSISAKGLTLHRQDTDLRKIIGDVLNRFQAELSSVGSSLEVHVLDHIIGQWDRARIDQVVVNLLSNAMKYGEGKPIEISTESTPTVARIVVVDHGMGISRKDQERIFDRFERVGSVQGIAGMGLGLYITRQIVEAHGGTISVVSEPGNGSKFTVELPLHGAHRGDVTPRAYGDAPVLH